MKSALPQVGMTCACDRDCRLIARDDRLDHRLAVRPDIVADRQHGVHHGAARMHGTLPVAVIKLDPVSRCAAQKSGVEQIGAARSARHRDAPASAHRSERGLCMRCHIAGSPADHYTGGVEEMPARVVAHLRIETIKAKPAHELDQRCRSASGALQCVDRFGVCHRGLRVLSES